MTISPRVRLDIKSKAAAHRYGNHYVRQWGYLSAGVPGPQRNGDTVPDEISGWIVGRQRICDRNPSRY